MAESTFELFRIDEGRFQRDEPFDLNVSDLVGEIIEPSESKDSHTLLVDRAVPVRSS